MAEADFMSKANTEQAIFEPFEWKKVDPSKCVEVLENFKSITLAAIKTLEIIKDNFCLKKTANPRYYRLMQKPLAQVCDWFPENVIQQSPRRMR